MAPSPTEAASELTVDVDTRLGQGAHGAVLKGSWCGRPVAVKTGLRVDEVDALKKEIHAMEVYIAKIICVSQNACKSPYLLQLLGVTSAPHVKLVLELMDGGDLR
ncbi:hypothetical protein ACHHYP_20523 [Achlya hypogyna]|uniref:Protein kinase domain-containing protein n=1 Tax=Achlya hypogyna TaxID=1202772 RepID=A0A1V9ZI32_ACHHY|nr:hypothetical protein ACHHYP_20523 [Achlya hypogyna]